MITADNHDGNDNDYHHENDDDDDVEEEDDDGEVQVCRVRTKSPIGWHPTLFAYQLCSYDDSDDNDSDDDGDNDSDCQTVPAKKRKYIWNFFGIHSKTHEIDRKIFQKP